MKFQAQRVVARSTMIMLRLVYDAINFMERVTLAMLILQPMDSKVCSFNSNSDNCPKIKM